MCCGTPMRRDEDHRYPASPTNCSSRSPTMASAFRRDNVFGRGLTGMHERVRALGGTSNCCATTV